MSSQFPTIVSGMIRGVLLRVESCRADVEQLLAQVRREYQEKLLESESPAETSGGSRTEPRASWLDTIQRSQQLQQTAAEFDRAVARVDEVLARLDDAVQVLEGNPSRFSPMTREMQQTSLEAVAIQAQEEERYRLAREIHDGPAQILANVALQLEYISKLATRDPLRAKEEIDTIQKDLRLAVGEVRRFMYDLRPPALAQNGVGSAIESHCQRLAQRFGMEIIVRWPPTTPLPAPQDSAVFRIVQEALQNIVKHARATRVEVQALEREGRLEVTVSDNGKGFELGEAQPLDPKHFGLAGMRARARQIGASLEVTSAPGQGTTVLLRVPLG